MHSGVPFVRTTAAIWVKCFPTRQMADSNSAIS